MLKTFTYNGISSADFGILIGSDPKPSRPARKFSVANIAGRNGNLYDIQDAWEEVIQEYQILAGIQMKETASKLFYRIFDWLNSANGYVELKDDYDLMHYRMAICVDATEVVTGLEKFGKATIRFRCRPERFLVSTAQIKIPGNLVKTTINNPTNHIAKPLISISRATTPGAYITVNGVTITLSKAFANDCYIDCETEDIYGTAGDNMNNIATVTKNGIVTSEFLKLVPGDNTIVISSVNGGWIVNPRRWEI